MTRTVVLLLLTCVVGVFFERPTLAQPLNGREPTIGHVLRLKFAGIPEELSLDESQKRKAQAVIAEIEAKMDALKPRFDAIKPDRTKGRPSNDVLRDLPRKRAEIMRPIVDEANQAITEFLRPEQIQRLHQIDFQSQGFGFLTDSAVKKALLLNAEQEGKIRKQPMEFLTKSRQARLAGGQNSEESIKDAIKLRSTLLDQVVDILDETQQKTWNDIAGKPYDFTTIEGK